MATQSTTDYVRMIIALIKRVGGSELDNHMASHGRMAVRELQAQVSGWFVIDETREDKSEAEQAHDTLVMEASVYIYDRMPRKALAAIADACLQLELDHANRIADLSKRRERLLGTRAVNRPKTGLLDRLPWADNDLMTASMPLEPSPEYLDRLEKVVGDLEEKLAARGFQSDQTLASGSTTNWRGDPDWRSDGRRPKPVKTNTSGWTGNARSSGVVMS